MNKQVIFFLSVFIFSPYLVLAQPPPKKFIKLGIIFSAKLTEKLGGEKKDHAFWDSGPPYWTPSQAEINLLESNFTQYLLEEKDPRANLLSSKIYSYGRQYLGVTSTSGRKVILANGFCSALGYSNLELQKNILRVKDGGDCFFQVHYDPEKNSFSSLLINGES